MGDDPMEAMMENLKKAKELDEDPTEKRRQRARRKGGTDADYESRANYRFGCHDCDHEAFRIQARGSVKKVVEADGENARCPMCGSDDVFVEHL